jgi:hypothetical protein
VDGLWFSRDAGELAVFDLKGNWYKWNRETGELLSHFKKAPWFEPGYFWYAGIPFPYDFAADGSRHFTTDSRFEIRVWSMVD